MKFKLSWLLGFQKHLPRRYMSSVKKCAVNENPNNIRNIGILAHIDAGKTTTTERMLFYSGVINAMGEVHHGNTVTDFMEQERQRGITITAASVTFPWGDHCFNLIDTPGHIDFTMEVEETLNVLDGVVVVLDATAGVEAQTVTVWRQTDKHKLPRLIYINKMDRPDARFFYCIDTVKNKLSVVPLALHHPYKEAMAFKGIINLIDLELLTWDCDSLGDKLARRPLQIADGKLWEDAILGRRQLTETLADCDDDLAEHIIRDDQTLENVAASRLRHSVQKVTLENKGIPVLCGSSYKNIGVQALMDAVALYLPSPLRQAKQSLAECFGRNLCARAFKVRHDSHKGPITFLRIYSGELKKGQRVYNIRQRQSERVDKLLIATADDYEEVDAAGLGSIVAVSGLKNTFTGDLMTNSVSVAESAERKMLGEESKEKLTSTIPDPVFFCSIECPSQAYQAALDKALDELTREDPSLRVQVDEETGQTVLAGMGELHLEIVKERIRREYSVQVELGPLQIAYKESLLSPARDSHSVNMKIGSSQHFVNITLSVSPCEGSGRDLALDRSTASAANISAIHPKHLVAVKSGIDSALNRGPKLCCPVINAKVTLHWLEVGRGTSESIIASATNQCLKKLLSCGGTKLLEPIMEMEIVCPQDLMTSVTADLNRRRGTLDHFSSRGTDKVLVAHVPLSELMGYASHLRSLTSGQASFSMQFHSLQTMSPYDEVKAIKSVTGLDPV